MDYFEEIVNTICKKFISAGYFVIAQHKGFIIDVYIDYKHTQPMNRPNILYITDLNIDVWDKFLNLNKKWLKLQFILTKDNKSEYDVLNAFDFDCVQLLFDGNTVKATNACIQSLNTGTFINYTMNSNSYFNSKLNRITKYIYRGWILLAPQQYWNYIKKLQSKSNSLALAINDDIISNKNEYYFNYIHYKNLFYFKNKNLDYFGIKQTFLHFLLKHLKSYL